MTYALVTASVVLAAAWLPLAARFLRGWRNRKNPVSLAICAALCLFAYSNVMFALVVLDSTTLRFLAIASHAFELVVVVNFYAAFRWSAKRFPEARGESREYTVPPMNVSNTSHEA